MSDGFDKEMRDEDLDKISGGASGGATHPMPPDGIRPSPPRTNPTQPIHDPIAPPRTNPVG
jgi:hypothetical protein